MKCVPTEVLPDDAGRRVLADLCDAALQYLAIATDIELEAWRPQPGSLRRQVGIDDADDGRRCARQGHCLGIFWGTA